MDWHASGITNDYEFEILDNSLAHVGWLDGVTGGTITQSYRGDYRVRATIETDGTEPPAGCYVRIWSVASLGGETVRTMLATLVPDLPGGEYSLGRWTRSIDLYSAMKRLDTALFVKDVGVAKNRNIVDFWRYLVQTGGAVDSVLSGTGIGKKTAEARVFEFGTPLLSACHELADMVGGYIGIVPSGKVQLQPYVLPSKRSASWSLDSGPGSVMHVGIGADAPDPVNRVIARYEGATQVWYATADVPASHPWSRARTGAVVAEVIDDPQGSGAGWLQKLVDSELASRSEVSGVYEVTTLFDPAIQPGTVGTVAYSDGPDGTGLSFKAFCSQREIALDAAMTTTLTLEELR